MSRRRATAERAGLAVAGGLLALLLALPLIALVAKTSPAALRAGLVHPLAASALGLSLATTATSLAVVVVLGTPLAWMLATTSGRWARAVGVVTELPMVIPPAVAGVALLLAFGRSGLGAGWLYPAGGSIAFTTVAVVLAQAFVSTPIYVQGAVSAFRRIDPDLVLVARTFGASPWVVFSRVAVPLAGPSLVAAGAMSWARALGEFGATLMFAGNLEGVTQTLPLAIYSALESDVRVAQALSVVLVGVALGVLVLVRGATLRASRDEGTS